MKINEGFLVHFIMTSLPSEFEAFKVNYNTQKDKWSMSELIAMTVQEEECLKLEKPDVAYLVAAESKKRKGKFHKKRNLIRSLKLMQVHPPALTNPLASPTTSFVAR